MFLGDTWRCPHHAEPPWALGDWGKRIQGLWYGKQGEASFQPARLPSNTNTGSAEESRVPSLSLGTERFILGFFITVRCWSYTDAACSPSNGKEIMHLGQQPGCRGFMLFKVFY